jgi:hypothetical protein
MMCPKCKEIAEFGCGSWNDWKPIMVFSCCSCNPKTNANEMIEATAEAENAFYESMGWE